jgi:hypothetical protein
MLFWNILLFVFKLVLIVLIYWILWNILRGVRQEMSERLNAVQAEDHSTPGRLLVVNPGQDNRTKPGQVFPLLPENRLGADKNNQIRLRDPFISGLHARLFWDGTEWWVEDQGSRNGTYVNQVQCPAFTPQPVPPGATLRLGGMTFRLQE